MKHLRKKIAIALMAGSVAFVPLAAPVAEANWIGVLGNVIYGTAMQYDIAYQNAIALGGVAEWQQNTLAELAAEYGGVSTDPVENTLVDEVMHQLIERGKYSMDARSLPFRWQVCNSREWNASCAPDDSITVFHGMLTGIHHDRDMLAGVLGHEMTHGLNHHAARHMAAGAAKEMLVRVGASLGQIAMQRGLNDAEVALIRLMHQYDAKKNTILPDEHEADEGGFHIASSAGFNPGGAAAAWAGMWEQMNYKTKPDFADFLNPSDHPDMDKRVKKMSELLTKYAYGHVRVKDNVNVYVDDTLLYTAQPAGEYLASEVAYLVAGGLAKNFHDKRLGSMWIFRHNPDGSVIYEPQGDAYKWARQAVNESGKGALLEQLVTKAYSSDSSTGIRDDLYAEELERIQKLDERTERLADLKDWMINQKIINSDFYGKAGLYDQAIAETNRVLGCGNATSSQMALAHNNKGAAYSRKRDYTKALEEYTAAINQRPGFVLALRNRADVYNRIGEHAKALEDCAIALSFANDTQEKATIYGIGATACDAVGDEEGALERYRQASLLNAAFDVPEKYASRLQ